MACGWPTAARRTQSVTQTYSGTIASAGAITTAPASLAFTYRQGDPDPGPQGLSVSSGGAAIAFTIAATTQSGGNWLAVSPTSGQTFVALKVSVSPGALAAGNYSGQLTITAPGASPSTVTVPVTLSVQGALSMSCTPPAGPTTAGGNYTATCKVNGGTAPFSWAITGGALPGGLTLTPSGATATISGAVRAAGSYNYTVTVTDGSSPAQSASQAYSGTVSAAGDFGDADGGADVAEFHLSRRRRRTAFAAESFGVQRRGGDAVHAWRRRRAAAAAGCR